MYVYICIYIYIYVRILTFSLHPIPTHSALPFAPPSPPSYSLTCSCAPLHPSHYVFSVMPRRDGTVYIKKGT